MLKKMAGGWIFLVMLALAGAGARLPLLGSHSAAAFLDNAIREGAARTANRGRAGFFLARKPLNRLIAAQTAPTATPFPDPAINAPPGGEALQGVVAISGSSAAPGFRSAEISFGYQDDPTGTWFLIAGSDAPVENGLLASWDTTLIADGSYRLRLQVFREGAPAIEQVVDGVRVRNYSPVETSTAAPTGESAPEVRAATVVPTRTPLRDYVPQRSEVTTPLPTNPATLTRADLGRSALTGTAVVFGMLALAGLYFGLRRKGGF